MLTDKNGNRFDESDTLYFTPPAWWGRESTCEPMLGRQVQVKHVVTHGSISTVALKSKDEVMADYLKRMRPRYFPTDWLTLID